MAMRFGAAQFSPVGRQTSVKAGGARVPDDQLSTAAPSPALTAASWNPSSPLSTSAWGSRALDAPVLGSWPDNFELPEAEGGACHGFVLQGLDALESCVADLLASAQPATPSTAGSGLSAQPATPLSSAAASVHSEEAPGPAEEPPASIPLPPGLEGPEEPVLPAGTVTAMLRNIPNKYTHDGLLKQLQERGFGAHTDFIYVPIDFRNRCNYGYAFINFRSAEACAAFAAEFHGADSCVKLPGYLSRKVCEVSPARHQGLRENVRRLCDSSVIVDLVRMGRTEWLPRIFGEHGEPLELPAPTEAAMRGAAAGAAWLRVEQRRPYGGAGRAGAAARRR